MPAFYVIERRLIRNSDDGKAVHRRSFVEDCVACDIIELSTISVEDRIAVLWWGGREEYSFESGCDIIPSLTLLK